MNLIPGESVKGMAFEKMLLPKYQSNDIENRSVLFPICPIRLSDLPGFNWSFLLVEMGDIMQKAPFVNSTTTSENNKQDLPFVLLNLAMVKLRCVHVFCPLGRLKSS